MIDLGTTTFHIQVPSLPPSELESYSTSLFDTWESSVAQSLAIDDYALSLRIEEGSVRGLAKIAAFLGALYIGIGEYGSFINGLQVIRDQVAIVSAELTNSALIGLPAPTRAPKIRRSGAALAKLQTLFNKVQRGDLTADEAMQEAVALLGSDGSEAPQFMSALHSALTDAPRFPQQISLPYESQNEDFVEVDRLPHAPIPSLPRPAPAVDRFRVEVWRDSKRAERHVTLIKL